jgi:multidrug efflux pump subunit AcrA (membrane-fusion protein)
VAAGQVTLVSPKVDEANRTVILGSVVDDSLGLLRAGRPLRARVVFHFGRAITIPEQAVWRDGGRSFVWVAQGRGAEVVARRRAVTLGEHIGDAWVVRSGVARGERVVVDGGRPLADGTPIFVAP